MHLVKDLKPLAALLCDLPFQMFPTELAKFVPSLLEDSISPVEAIAATRAFLHEHVPSAEHRLKVADWLEDLFPDHQCDREAQEEERLLGTGKQMLAPSVLRSVSRRLPVFGGTTALLALVGGGVLLVAHRGPGQAFSKARHVETTPVAVQELPVAQPTPEPPAPAPKATILDDQAGSVTASLDVPRAQPTMQPTMLDNRPTKSRSEGPSAEHLLHAADAAFGAGKRIEAVNMGIQALNAGGGLRAHLALGEYYRSLHRYQEALNHYRAAAEVAPENKLAVAGVNLLEKKLSPCQ
jgi:tetratricopeptide (TPR) repeat protein